MLEWKHIRPQNEVYQKYTLRKVPPEKYRPTSRVHREKPDHLPGRGMGPFSIVDHVGEDHRQMKSSCDVGGPKYPLPTVDGKIQSRRVGLSPRCHRMIKLNDHPRIIESTRHHEQLHLVSLYEEYGVSELYVHGKFREIVVNLPTEISPSIVNIPRDGVTREVRPPDNGCRG